MWVFVSIDNKDWLDKNHRWLNEFAELGFTRSEMATITSGIFMPNMSKQWSQRHFLMSYDKSKNNCDDRYRSADHNRYVCFVSGADNQYQSSCNHDYTDHRYTESGDQSETVVTNAGHSNKSQSDGQNAREYRPN